MAEVFDEFEFDPDERIDNAASDVARGASDLATSWHLRPTAELRVPEEEVDALFLLLHGEQAATEFHAEPSNWVVHFDEEEITEPLERMRRALPFSDDEIELLRAAHPCWSHETRSWTSQPPEAVEALIANWHQWLREPADETGEEYISVGAAELYISYVVLYEHLRDYREYEKRETGDPREGH